MSRVHSTRGFFSFLVFTVFIFFFFYLAKTTRFRSLFLSFKEMLRMFRRSCLVPSQRRHPVRTPQRGVSWSNPVELLSSPVGLLGLLLGRRRTVSQSGSGPSPKEEEKKLEDKDSPPAFNKEAAALALVVLLVAAAWELAQRQWSLLSTKVKEMLYVTLEVRSHQEEYDMLMDWLSHCAKVGNGTTRNLSFKSHSGIVDGDDASDDDNGRDVEGGMSMEGKYIPGFGLHVIPFAGKSLWVTRSVDEAKKYQSNWHRAVDEVLTIVCLSRRRDTLDQLMMDVRRNWQLQAQKYVNIYVANPSVGGWDRLCRKAKRPLDTLYLPSATMNVVEELQRFLQSGEKYARLGVPWRRGYLFDGPPGTGKSSLIFGLAGHFGLPLHILSLKDKGMTDTQLLKSVNSVPRRSILVLEDLETAVHGSDEIAGSAAEGHVTVSGLLNALDGIASSDGRILVITANKPEKLPAALLRAGRVDRRISFSLIGDKEIESMVWNFCTTSTDSTEGTQRCVEQAQRELVARGKTGQRASPAEVQNALLDIVTLAAIHPSPAAK
jgi:chaperone BCS1